MFGGKICIGHELHYENLLWFNAQIYVHCTNIHSKSKYIPHVDYIVKYQHLINHCCLHKKQTCNQLQLQQINSIFILLHIYMCVRKLSESWRSDVQL